MKTIYKRFILSILSLVAILSVGFVLNASQMSKPVLATTSYDFNLANGASIRTNLKTNIGDIDNAIRFSTYLKKSDLETARVSGDVKVYTLIAKYEELKAKTENFDEDNLADYMTLEHFNEAKVPCINALFTGERLENACELDDYYKYNVCIYNLSDEELTIKFIARSYLVVDEDTENAQYTDVIAIRSMFDVAEALVEAKNQNDPDAIDEYNSNPTLIDYLSTKFNVTINSEFEESVVVNNIPRGQKLSDFANEYQAISTDKEGLAYFNGFKEGEAAFDVSKAITGDNTDITLTADYTSLLFTLWDDAGEEGYAVTGYESGFFSSERTEVNIPEDFEYNGKKVICVDVNAFKNSGVKTVKLFADIKYIGQGAFYNCSNLETIIMPYATVFFAKAVADSDYDYTGQSSEARNIFYNSNKLAKAVVNKDAIIARKTFFSTVNSITDLYIDGTENNIVIKSNNDMLTGKRYLKGTKCGEWQYDSDGIPFVAVEEHVYEDGICTICGDYQTKGLTYTYNSTYDGYMVSYGSCTATEVYVPKEYDDGGTNGKKDVVGLAGTAFWGKTAVTKIVLPKTVKYATTFSLGGLSSVETIIMPGITEFYGAGDIKLFWNNSNLTTIVVSPDIVWGTNVFANNNKFTEINICVDSTEKWVEMPADSNGVVTGNIFLYNETSNAQCGSWTYVDGTPTPSTASHSYNDTYNCLCDVCGYIEPHEHVENYENPTGKCRDCGKVLTEGLTYTAIYENDEIVAYEVSKGTCTDTTIYVLSEYNGKPVTTVAANGFQSATATKIVLPRSVENVKYAAFSSSAVQTVIMPGVVNFYNADGTLNTSTSGSGTTNAFLNCHALRNIVVNSEINVGRQTFHSASNPAQNTNGITIFIDGDSDSTKINSSKNGMLNTTVKYLKGTKCGEWQYNSDGIPFVAAEEHVYEDGICTICGDYQTKGLTYTAIYENDEIVAYEVSKGTCTDTAIYVLSEYNGKPVTTVAQNGFTSVAATKIVLPSSVVNVKSGAFSSSTVQTVIMPGVVNFYDANGNLNTSTSGSGTTNAFLNCHALKNIVVNSGINVGRQTFYSTSSTNTNGITIFIDGDSDSTKINSSKNGMLNTTVKYLKSEWQYNSDGIPALLSGE